MFTIVLTLIILVCFLLGAVVLIQKPKGGGLNAQFGGVGNQIFGVSRTTDIIEKATWVLAAALMILCLSSASFLGKYVANKEGGNGPKKTTTTKEKSDIEKEMKNSPNTNLPGIPAAPTK
jgi:preprotein translocase subunit SecG